VMEEVVLHGSVTAPIRPTVPRPIAVPPLAATGSEDETGN
jgi:hypothetical protein